MNVHPSGGRNFKRTTRIKLKRFSLSLSLLFHRIPHVSLEIRSLENCRIDIHEKFNARNNNKKQQQDTIGDAIAEEEKENVEAEVDKEQGARSPKVLEGEGESKRIKCTLLPGASRSIVMISGH